MNLFRQIDVAVVDNKYKSKTEIEIKKQIFEIELICTSIAIQIERNLTKCIHYFDNFDIHHEI